MRGTNHRVVCDNCSSEAEECLCRDCFNEAIEKAYDEGKEAGYKEALDEIDGTE